jgi:tRNA (cytidine/uridine-2'-O-)-methyltransferase
MFNVVLVEPEIPPNTGNVARLCAVTQSTLHLVGPLGFEFNEKTLQRAGMDYWKMVDYKVWKNWEHFASENPDDRFFFIETGGQKTYFEAQFQKGDYLIFGRETKGLASSIIDKYREKCFEIPMYHPESRSLNLSNCAAMVVYEGIRQVNFS